MDIKINTITLEIKGKKLELTLEECNELFAILDKIVAKKPEITISSQWPLIPNGNGTINTPYRTSDYPFPKPVFTWCEDIGTSGTSNNIDLEISSTN